MNSRQDLALANRILFQQDILDGFGHVSMRNPDDRDSFLISRSLAPALVKGEDIVTVDFGGRQIDGGESRLYLERFIHAAIYKARGDVNGIVHSHSAAILPFTISRSRRLQAVTHMAGFICRPAPVYDVRDHEHGDCDMLVRDLRMGEDLAAKLAGDPLVLMRGHGVTVVGKDLREAVFRSVYAEQNAKVQMCAIAMGDYTALTPGEAALADETNSGQVDRAWRLWAMDAGADTGQPWTASTVGSGIADLRS